MGVRKQKSLTVAPFECAWRQELKFKEAGRGCVAFEASALNDVTVIFREQVGSQHYHYKRDSSANYTIVLGSHRNRRLKIEVAGETVVDVAGVGLCCSSGFQSYWISIYDGLICIGKGSHPFQNLVFQWLDSEPNRSVQYVGLSSWDKHVGYRNVNVLPLTQQYNCLWKPVHYNKYAGEEGEEYEAESYEEGGRENFLESWELSDMFFAVGVEEKLVPAHMVIMASSGNFTFTSPNERVIRLPSVTYSILHALLEYIYTGRTEIEESQLGPLRDLSLQFQVSSLVKQCEENIDRFKMDKKLFDSGKVELAHLSPQLHHCVGFPSELPVDVLKLKQLLLTGEHSDVGIYLDGHGLVAQSHKIILSLWSSPFMKMFTNGMSESNSSEICFKDVNQAAFSAMLQFMYSGELEMNDSDDTSSMLLPLLLLADQFGVTLLHQECCKNILDCLSEDTVCPILQVVSSIPSCKLLEETCERKFAMHFNYCTTACCDFVLLDEATFKNILQHPDLTVTSEEIVMDAILLWCKQASEVCGWEAVDELLISSTPELLFGERLASMAILLPFVRFPLMPLNLLSKLEKSNLSRQITAFEQLVKEAIEYSNGEMKRLGNDHNIRIQHRRSSFKELQHICDGDNNGVMYFAGTSYGEHQWVNPVLAKKVTITASSPSSRYTDPKALVSRTYQGTSFAGPRVENGRNCAWWMVDIGQDHQLMCNYYTLRQDGSAAYIRLWALQGSLDGQNWTNLSIHENDQTICKPGQFASWPVHGSNSKLPFRFFRVYLTGPTTSDSTPWNLCICFWELYGHFH